MKEQTLVIVKPDAVRKGDTQAIAQYYIDAGLNVIGQRGPLLISTEEATALYQEHEDKFFFAGLVLAMTSGPSVLLLIEGDDAVARVRSLNGATNPAEAEPGTIRQKFRSAGGPFNTVHGSADIKSAERELAIFFPNAGTPITELGAAKERFLMHWATLSATEYTVRCNLRELELVAAAIASSVIAAETSRAAEAALIHLLGWVNGQLAEVIAEAGITK